MLILITFGAVFQNTGSIRIHIESGAQAYKNSLSTNKNCTKKALPKTKSKPLFPRIDKFPFRQLLPFVDRQNQRNNTVPGIDFQEQDYFTLLDWTGRAVRQDKRGAIPATILPILERMQVNEDEWMNMVNHFGRLFFAPPPSLCNLSK